ncbi:MAG: ACP S-malonyltransferase [Deltaproteobacteria bacterium]|nr:ACP S-malonyltransferase [Deltaproteobacteria bacterium]
MSNILAMFPGQGSQYVGMARDLLNQFPRLAIVFEEAEEACKLPIRRLCDDGPETELRLTENQQPCILTVSSAMWKILQEESGIKPQLYAGHSLGEYSALVAAGKLTLWDAARLVRERGRAMQEAVPQGIGAMAAVLKADERELLALCQELWQLDKRVEIANYNSPEQHIISGHKEAVDALAKKLAEKKIRSLPLPVSAPFHSSLMTSAKETMLPLLKTLALNSTPEKVIANVSGEVEQPYKYELLVEQIDHPVLWTKSVETALNQGCRLLVEIGPGNILCNLVKRWIPKDIEVKTGLEFLRST